MVLDAAVPRSGVKAVIASVPAANSSTNIRRNAQMFETAWFFTGSPPILMVLTASGLM